MLNNKKDTDKQTFGSKAINLSNVLITLLVLWVQIYWVIKLIGENGPIWMLSADITLALGALLKLYFDMKKMHED